MPVDILPDALNAWCRQHLGSPPTSELFRSGYLSAVIGLRLADGRDVVVKLRPGAARLHACHVLHLHAYRQGLPCPEPLVGPAPLGDHVATAEAYLPGGAEYPSSPRSPQLYAKHLARLVRVTSAVKEALDLEPPLPWLGWAHKEPGLWPTPDIGEDLNAQPDDWLDGIAAQVRQRLARDRHPLVIGHGDWYPSNLRWRGDELVAVHDWDSMAQHSEASLAGAVASMYCMVRGATSLEETEAFLDAYAAERGRTWSGDELEIAWAAGLWRLAFDAKKESLDPGDGPNLRYLHEQAAERLRRSGA